MRIGGLQKLTLLDYPGKVACTVFLSGCNLRCPYCHNPGLVLPEQSEGSEIPEAEVLSFLERRKGKLDGVCITGGEPTLQPELPEFLEKLRRLGYAVKLDTNGTNPAMLKALLQERVLDYVAMDIKNSPSRYAETCGGIDCLSRVRESAALLMDGTRDLQLPRRRVFRGELSVRAKRHPSAACQGLHQEPEAERLPFAACHLRGAGVPVIRTALHAGRGSATHHRHGLLGKPGACAAV